MIGRDIGTTFRTIREQDPLKQGLKLLKPSSTTYS